MEPWPPVMFHVCMKHIGTFKDIARISHVKLTAQHLCLLVLVVMVGCDWNMVCKVQKSTIVKLDYLYIIHTHCHLSLTAQFVLDAPKHGADTVLYKA